MKRLAAVALLLLTACGSPTTGVVVEKRYDDPDTWVETRTVYSTECDRKGACRQRASGTIPIVHNDPARWELKLDDGQDSGWVQVDERTYHGIQVGSIYNQKTGQVES